MKPAPTPPLAFNRANDSDADAYTVGPTTGTVSAWLAIPTSVVPLTNAPPESAHSVGVAVTMSVSVRTSSTLPQVIDVAAPLLHTCCPGAAGPMSVTVTPPVDATGITFSGSSSMTP